MEESHWPLVNRLIWKYVIPAAKLQCEGITVLKTQDIHLNSICTSEFVYLFFKSKA